MIEKIRAWLKEVNLAEINSLEYNTAVVILSIMLSDNWTDKTLIDITRLERWELKFILTSLRHHEVLVGDKIVLEDPPGDFGVSFITELTLLCLLVSNKVHRETISPEKMKKIDKYKKMGVI